MSIRVWTYEKEPPVFTVQSAFGEKKEFPIKLYQAQIKPLQLKNLDSIDEKFKKILGM